MRKTPIISLFYSTECQTNLYFPRTTQITEYIRIITPLPELYEFTVCAWIKSEGTTGKFNGAVISYAASENDNSILLVGDNIYVTKISINNQDATVPNVMENGVEYHACFTRAISPHSVKWYVDGIMETDLTSSFTLNEPIPAGGVAILGQEQDDLAGSFHATEAFAGEIQNPTIWNRVLSLEEIKVLSDTSCSCIPYDVVLKATSDVVQLEGAAALIPTVDCSPH